MSKSLLEQPAASDESFPDWFVQLQQEAQEASEAIPTPSRRDEAWRFANLEHLAAIDQYAAAEPVSAATQEDLVARSNQLEASDGKFVFINESLAHAEKPNADGLICVPLAEAVVSHAQLLQEYFMAQEATLGSAKYALLHKSRTKSGLFIYVPAGMELTVPIEVYHWAQGDRSSIFPHTLIVTGENAKVTVVDYYQSATADEGHFNAAVVDLVAGRGSHLRYVACQDLSHASANIHISSTLASADADVKSLQVQLGSTWSRTESVSHLAGKGANSDMLSVAVPTGNQEVDQRTLQHHAEPHTTSDLLYKNALYDKTRTIFAGLIQVDEGAHYTDAYQTCRNLLLSNDAEANAMPGLEINADQVKCSHGSTSGPITEEEIFYFNARGIPTHAAKKLITFGFTAEAFAKIGDEAIESMVASLLEKRLHAAS